jgi:2-(1,2-epoxy-1,2-dihydrophenyl)acetyl-CoA isomerase
MRPVQLEYRAGIAWLTLDRPGQRNSFDLAMAQALADGVAQLAAEPPRVVVLRSRGGHFSVGGDIHHFQALLDGSQQDQVAGVTQLLGAVNEAVLGLTRLPCPVLGLLEGAVAGFGLSLALACDLLIASENARLVLAYGGIGISPDGGGSWHLPRQLGLHRALAMALLDTPLTAAEAQRLGLVVQVVAPGELAAAGQAMAQRLACGSGAAQAASKRLLREGLERDLGAGLQAEQALFTQLSTQADFAEGVAAFRARRTPCFGAKTQG